MGIVKGSLEFKKFKSGKSLTRKQAILAQCYECNGYEADDCLAEHCVLYQWSPYRKRLLKMQEKAQKPRLPGKIPPQFSQQAHQK